MLFAIPLNLHERRIVESYGGNAGGCHAPRCKNGAGGYFSGALATASEQVFDYRISTTSGGVRNTTSLNNAQEYVPVHGKRIESVTHETGPAISAIRARRNAYLRRLGEVCLSLS